MYLCVEANSWNCIDAFTYIIDELMHSTSDSSQWVICYHTYVWDRSLHSREYDRGKRYLLQKPRKYGGFEVLSEITFLKVQVIHHAGALSPHNNGHVTYLLRVPTHASGRVPHYVVSFTRPSPYFYCYFFCFVFRAWGEPEEASISQLKNKGYMHAYIQNAYLINLPTHVHL